MNNIDLIGYISIAYLLGSIPFGYLLPKLLLKKDIRKIGSGNIGVTNVLRTGHKSLATITLLLDAGKGATAVLMAKAIYTDTNFLYLIALTVVIGHIFPVWLKFKGGKGIATGLGVLAVLSWQVALIGVGLWIIVAAISKISSLAGIVSFLFAPLFAWYVVDEKFAFFVLILAFVILARHITNIKRLLQGEETKLGKNHQ